MICTKLPNISTELAIIAAVFVQIFYSSTALLPATLVTLLNVALVIIFEGSRLIRNGGLKMPWSKSSASAPGTDNEEEEEEILLDSVLDNEDEREDAFLDRPAWDIPLTKRFGHQALSPKLLNAMMTGVVEPVKNYQYCLLMAFAITMTTPLAPEFQPPLEEDGTFEYAVNTINGLPWWVFKAIILLFVSSLVSIPMILSIQDDFPYDEKSLLRSGINPDVVDLEPDEKGGRKNYDDVNEAARFRRVMIRAETIRIRKANVEAKRRAESLVKKEGDTLDARDHLRSLVKNPTMRNVKFAIEEDPIEEEVSGEVDNEDPADEIEMAA